VHTHHGNVDLVAGRNQPLGQAAACVDFRKYRRFMKSSSLRSIQTHADEPIAFRQREPLPPGMPTHEIVSGPARNRTLPAKPSAGKTAFQCLQDTFEIMARAWMPPVHLVGERAGCAGHAS
jgi:hypothetical protein